MRIAMVGLGKMGLNMTRRLLRGGHEVVAADRSANAVKEAAREGALPAASVADAAAKLSPPRVVWLMVPAGPPVDENVELLAGTLKAGDVVVVDDLKLAAPKTKEFVAVIKSLGLAGHTVLLVSSGGDKNLMLSARNVPDVTLTTGALLNTYQLLLCDKLVFTRSAYEQFELRLNKN